MALPLGEYPCHHLDHGPDTVEVHREDYEIALDAKEKLKVATGTIRKLRIAYAKSMKMHWEHVVDLDDAMSWNTDTLYQLDGTAVYEGRGARICRTAAEWLRIWNLVHSKLE